MATGNSTLVVNGLLMYMTSYISGDIIQDIQMYRYPPSTLHRYLDLPSTPIIQTHTDPTPPHPSRPWSKPPPTLHLHHPHQNIHTRPTPHCSHRIGKAQTKSSHPLTPSPLTPPRTKHIHISQIKTSFEAYKRYIMYKYNNNYNEIRRRNNDDKNE